MNHALYGLLRQLPPSNGVFQPGQKKKWLAAFEAIIDLDYPSEQAKSDSPQPQQPTSDTPE